MVRFFVSLFLLCFVCCFIKRVCIYSKCFLGVGQDRSYCQLEQAFPTLDPFMTKAKYLMNTMWVTVLAFSSSGLPCGSDMKRYET